MFSQKFLSLSLNISPSQGIQHWMKHIKIFEFFANASYKLSPKELLTGA